jgi:DNA mismatch repair protein MutS
MMQQYESIRRTLPKDTLLLFRLGDFYELFYEDAKIVSELLNLSLTKRQTAPMCGVPYHAADGYISRLIKKGKRVAICDQVSEPQPGKIVERQVTQIISPGTVNDARLLEARQNNYLAAINPVGNKGIGFALLDISTGDFRITELSSISTVLDELVRFGPAEIIAPESADLKGIDRLMPYDEYTFEPGHAEYLLLEQFKVQSLDGYGCSEMKAAIGAAGACLHYLQHQLRRNTKHVKSLGVYLPDEHVSLDAATQLNLELTQSRAGTGTLLSALDKSVTAMGARLLRNWILKPLRTVPGIRKRHSAIAQLLEQPFLLSSIRESLKEVKDIERTLGRLSQGTGNPRDLGALGHSLTALPGLMEHLDALEKSRLSDEAENSLAAVKIFPLPEVVDLLKTALNDELPALVKEGAIFRTGYHQGLDELRAASTDGKEWIASLQQREIERTGIKSLKVRFNSVFGYFIEITKSNLDSVPEDYTRKQTTANGERYITPELKEVEAKILGADERSRALEYELFLELKDRVLDFLVELQQTARSVAMLDALAGLAETARLYGYCRPVLSDGLELNIRDGRHPVLDQNLTEEKFVPNDCVLSGEGQRLMLITGPNMAGKSTFIRQIALIVLMAQAGSFVPATLAEIGVVDRIFTRVGASDDLSRGQSTFMVEMNETANIVNNASERSLVILDEIGRGTSTFDGLAIAWSVAEYLHDILKSRTLFATHYHEMTELAMICPGVKNCNVAVREWNDQIIFLRKIQEGAADKSYGIQVARLAGLPQAIVDRAKEILTNLEASELNAQGRPRLAEAKVFKTKAKRKEEPKSQMSLFDVGTESR